MGLQGDCITVWLWCYQGQLHGSENGTLREPRGSQLPADPLWREPPVSHVHFASKSFKGIPRVLFYVHWTPLFDAMILCVFMTLKSLSYGHVISCFWSKCLFKVFHGTLNILKLYTPKQLLRTTDDPNQSHLQSINELAIHRILPLYTFIVYVNDISIIAWQ